MSPFLKRLGALAVLAWLAGLPCACSRTSTASFFPGAPAPPPPPPVPPPFLAGNGQSDQRTLSGTVLDPRTGLGIAGAVVIAGNPAAALTDSEGRFVLFDPGPGTAEVTINASALGDFPVLRLPADVKVEGPSVMPGPLVPPDAADPRTAAATVPVNAAGSATADVTVAGGDPDLSLFVPAGTLIQIDGESASTAVDLSAIPVDPRNLPVPLPAAEALDGAAFASVQPAGAAFDSGGGLGLDLTLPNDRGFPAGTVVDVWSFDRAAGEWVNRSAQTGMQGVVVSLGGGASRIEAAGVVTNGGWHTAAAPVAAPCGTTLKGRVVDAAGEPIAGVTVRTALGQAGLTNSLGRFVIPSVPAYDASLLPGTCAPAGVEVGLLAPVAFGAGSDTVLVAAGAIAPGGDTDLGDLTLTPPGRGSIAGSVLLNGVGTAGSVEITGTETRMVDTASTGAFFATDLLPGTYQATFPFTPRPVQVDFEVAIRSITTLNVQKLEGSGSGELTVLVLREDDGDAGTPPVPVGGARVHLAGSDALSTAGVEAVTNQDGEVLVRLVDGPFTLTAQKDFNLPGAPSLAVRQAATVVDLAAATGTAGVLFDALRDPNLPNLVSTLGGTVANVAGLPPNQFLRVGVRGRGPALPFRDVDSVNLVTGIWSLFVPPDQVLDAALINGRAVPGEPRRTLKAAHRFGLGPVPAGGVQVANFDAAGPDVFSFDQAAGVSFSNPLAAPDAWQVLFGLDAGGLAFLDFEAAFDDTGLALPASVLIPALSDPNLSGLGVSLSASMEKDNGSGNLSAVVCKKILSSQPATAAFAFPEVPLLLMPAPGASLSIAALEALAVDFTLGALPLAAGRNRVQIRSSTDPGLGLDRVDWSLFLPAASTAVTLPPTAEPMFSAAVDYRLSVEAVRFEGAAFDYEDFFSADLAARSMALGDALESCSASLEVSLASSP